VFVALVAELRMLSSGESSVMMNSPAIVKCEHERHIVSDSESMMTDVLEPGMLFDEAFPDSLVMALRRLVFGQLTEQTDVYRWKSLGYWLCCQLMSLLRSSDVFCQTVALKTLADVPAAFLDSLHGIRERYFITCGAFVC